MEAPQVETNGCDAGVRVWAIGLVTCDTLGFAVVSESLITLSIGSRNELGAAIGRKAFNVICNSILCISTQVPPKLLRLNANQLHHASEGQLFTFGPFRIRLLVTSLIENAKPVPPLKSWLPCRCGYCSLLDSCSMPKSSLIPCTERQMTVLTPHLEDHLVRPVRAAKAEAGAKVVDQMSLLLDGGQKSLVDGLLVCDTVLCGLLLLSHLLVLSLVMLGSL